MAKEHKGAPRMYWCTEFLDENGKLKRDPTQPAGTPPEYAARGGCEMVVLRHGDAVPICNEHHLLMRKARFKFAQEKQQEVWSKEKMTVGGVSYWSDEAVRKSKCRLCNGDIERGERRIAMDSRLPRARPTGGGGFITRNRAYVHAACFIDMVFGGEAGEGCPGCSAKILHDEFMQVRDLLVKEYK